MKGVEFALTPDELMLAGCRLNHDRLTIRPTLPTQLMTWIVLAFSLALLLVAVFLPEAVLAVPAVAGVLIAWRGWKTKVVASPTELTVVNRWETCRLPWSDVTVIRVEPDGRDWRWPYSGPMQFGKPKLCVGVIVSSDHRLEADALVSTSASEGWGFSQAVAAEKKVAILERWRKAVAVQCRTCQAGSQRSSGGRPYTPTGVTRCRHSVGVKGP